MLSAAPSNGRQALVAVHLILFFVSPLGALAASDQATDERKGRTIVQINCATCHAVGRQGDSPMKKAPPPRSAQAVPCRKPSGGARGRNCYWSRHDAGVQVRTEAGGRDHRLPQDSGATMSQSADTQLKSRALKRTDTIGRTSTALSALLLTAERR